MISPIDSWWLNGLLLSMILVIAMNGCEEPHGGLHPPDETARAVERNQMVDEQLIPGGVTDPRLLSALRRIPRHEFIPGSVASEAYADSALRIGYGQTITQPLLVGLMTQALELHGPEKVLEIGTGSGYQAAVLAELVARVYTIEVIDPLARRAAEVLKDLGYNNVVTRIGDGYNGWPEEAPFDAIIVTAAPDRVPQPLLDQLAVNGRLIVPVGKEAQQLLLYRRTPTGYMHTILDSVRFVPLVHEQEPPSSK